MLTPGLSTRLNALKRVVRVVEVQRYRASSDARFLRLQSMARSPLFQALLLTGWLVNRRSGGDFWENLDGMIKKWRSAGTEPRARITGATVLDLLGQGLGEVGISCGSRLGLSGSDMGSVYDHMLKAAFASCFCAFSNQETRRVVGVYKGPEKGLLFFDPELGEFILHDREAWVVWMRYIQKWEDSQFNQVSLKFY